MSNSKEQCIQYSSCIQEFRKMIDDNPRMPRDLDEILLLRFIKITDFNLEEAKRLLIHNFELRSKCPKIFLNRSFDSKEIQSAMKNSKILELPSRTAENYSIFVCQLTFHDAKDFNFLDIMKYSIAFMEATLISSNPLSNGSIAIFDAKNFTFKHLFEIISWFKTLSVLNKFMEEAVGIKILRNHYINTSQAVEKLLNFVRKIVSKEIAESFMAHSSLNSLYEHVPRELLPIEYGGDAGYFDELYETNMKEIEKNFDYIADNSKWKFVED